MIAYQFESETTTMLRFLFLFALCCIPAFSARLPYIVNGKNVDSPGKYPFQVSLQRFNRHACGAVIISPRYILSAAHCVSSPPAYYTALVGAHDIKTKKQGKPTAYAVESYVKHPDYRRPPGLNAHDISIIKLKTAIDMTNPFVGRVALAAADAGQMVGANCIITGWGNTQIGSSGAPDILQEAATKPLSYEACRKRVGEHPRFTEDYVVRSHICIGAQGSNFAGSCHGDSGGPLTCNVGGKVVLAGLTSWGSPDCNPTWPTMYTRITSHRDWIKTVTGI